jgi:D-glycero-D-manno-heptose 1,7-bisphosphate phosphatase
MRRAVFLDRDGVINRAVIRKGRPYPPATLEELKILPGVVDALARLHQAGYILIVVTNQPDVARGSQTREQVEKLHQALQAQLPLDDFRVCYHDDADACQCRKPKPGLLCDAASEWQIDLTRSIMIGDRWRDIEAGQNAGCQTVFIDYNYVERRPVSYDQCVDSLAQAAEWILIHEEE